MNDTKNDNTHLNMYNLLKLRELYMKRSTWIQDFAAPKNNMNIAAPRKNSHNQFYGAACSGSLKNK